MTAIQRASAPSIVALAVLLALIAGGHAPFAASSYKAVPGWGQLPDGEKWGEVPNVAIDPAGTICNTAQLAVEELFTNLVKYSRGGKSDIRIDLARDGGRLIVSLTDFDVEPFDIRTVPDAKTDLSLAERKPGGLGIHLVKRLVDHIDYEYADRNSTTTFIKNLE